MADRTERAAVGRIDLAYETFGHEKNAPPLLLIAGLATQLLGWDERFCMQLADNGFRVIRFDNRDIGRSRPSSTTPVFRTLWPYWPRQGGGPRAYTLEDMADDTAGSSTRSGSTRAHVVGASMGGMIAQPRLRPSPPRPKPASIMSTTTAERGMRVGGRAGVAAAQLPRGVGRPIVPCAFTA